MVTVVEGIGDGCGRLVVRGGWKVGRTVVEDSGYVGRRYWFWLWEIVVMVLNHCGNIGGRNR